MKIRVAVLTPVYGDPKGKWVQALTNMMNYFYRHPIEGPDGSPCEVELENFFVTSSMLTESRHKLVAEALHWGATHMLWADADHTFPDDALHRLLSHNKAVVGVNYVRRCIPTAPTACRLSGKVDGDERLLYTTREMAEEGLVEEVAHIGFGLCLIDMRVLDVLQAHAEQEGKEGFLPLFHFEVKSDGSGVRGEDVFFFEKLRAAGVSIWCDHALSWEVGHLHDVLLTNDMGNSQRDAWRQRAISLRERYEPKTESVGGEQ